MFVLRRGSRNQTDELAGTVLEKNYLKIFGMRLPLMDTVDAFLSKLPAEELERLRELLVRQLMERKVFEKWKFQGYYNLSFDATGVHTYDDEPYENCCYKETKNGIKWYVNVLEAKLVFANGFSISLGSEYLVNQQGKFDKQDCENAAFKRLAAAIKGKFPRLALLVTADGLYCNEPIFKLINSYGWKFIFTFKDDALKSLWKTIHAQTPIHVEHLIGKNKAQQWEYDRFSFINELDYRTVQVNYVAHTRYLSNAPDDLLQRHVHLTNLAIHKENVKALSAQGRMRWNIENQGFNNQKNQGFGLAHKYARKDFNRMKNYYLLLQIGHMISQLVEKCYSFKTALEESGKTMKGLLEDVVCVLKSPVGLLEVHRQACKTKQLRY